MEFDFIAQVRSQQAQHPAVKLGIGDDCAWLRLPWPGNAAAPRNFPREPIAAGDCLATVDMLTDLVDFDLRTDAPERIGRKALAVNLSDIAAMAGKPVAALVALVLPRSGIQNGGGRALADGLYAGLLPLAQQYGVAIAGGDTNSWDGPLAISITVLGVPHPRGLLTRRGAQPGDRILVTGPCGGSLIGHQFDFEPRLELATALMDQFELHAGIDISDGLSKDLGHLLEESQVGAILDLDRIPIAAAAFTMSAAQPAGPTPLERALGDGEDFELLLAVPPGLAEALCDCPIAGAKLVDIGEFTAEPGLRQRDSSGNITPLIARGYEHQI